MKLKLCIVASGMLLSFWGMAQAQNSQGAQPGQSKDPQASATKSAEKKIGEQHRADMDKCKPLKSNAKDICKAEADGRKKVAEAEMKVQQRNTPKNQYELYVAKAEAQYDVAKQRCDDQIADAKNACQKTAKAARDRAMAEADKLSQAAGGPAVTPAAAAPPGAGSQPSK
jgi:hypothetical protein